MTIQIVDFQTTGLFVCLQCKELMVHWENLDIFNLKQSLSNLYREKMTQKVPNVKYRCRSKTTLALVATLFALPSNNGWKH